MSLDPDEDVIVTAGAPEGSAVMLARGVSEARARLEERKARP